MRRARPSTRCRHRPGPFVLAAALGLLGSPLPAPAAPEPADEKGSGVAVPAFETEEAKELFEQGKTHFEAGEYKDAYKAFRRVARGVASREDRETLELWVRGAKYAPAIARAELLVKKKQHHTAYAYLLKLLPHLRGTPAMGPWQKRFQELDSLLFQSIEAFDYVRRDYSPKYGKTFVDDEELVFKGPRCLRWKNTPDRKPGNLKVRRVPRNWTAYRAVEFWVRTETTVPTEVLIMTDAGRADDDGPKRRRPAPAGAKIQTSFMRPLTIKARPGEWQRIELPLETFKEQGGATLGKVKDFRIQIRGGRKYDLLIDEIRLMKKDPGAGGGRR